MNVPREKEETAAARAVADALPPGGLIAGRNWLVSPRPLPLDPLLLRDLERLGRDLARWERACDDLYLSSARGAAPAWIARLMDAGKPAELVAAGRDRRLRAARALVLRPDILLTEDGMAITELDSVPGGLGLTAWLNRTYADLGFDVVGGRDAMMEGFARVAGDRDIVISEESGSYRPEMEWLAAQVRERGTQGGAASSVAVHGDADYRPRAGRGVYRFFELFDLDNVACAGELLAGARAGAIDVTPPFKPHLEEKLWFALFWLRPLDGYWRQALGERLLLRLRGMLPYTWIVDPTPLPHFAALPRLDAHSWDDVSRFSQKQRALVLKISGFSPLAWGSRGVVIGFDVPQDAWAHAIRTALDQFPHNPWVLQEFRKTRLVEHPYLDTGTGGGEIRTLRGRVRLCPYYLPGEKGDDVALSGILASIVPADKKLIHGMRDAILAPCMPAPDAPATLSQSPSSPQAL